ncbi:MAG: hypothetical protein ACYDC2_12025 [Solirubrobacteraceae bacterium]
MSARTVRTAAVLIMGAVAFVSAGCGGGGSDVSSAGVRLQREDLIAVVHALQGTQAEAAAELQATKLAWRYVLHGLPRAPSAQARSAIEQAEAHAAALRVPPLFGEVRSRELTGAAAALAGEYRSFAALSSAAWRQLAYALSLTRAGRGAAAGFSRANAALYIETVYDAHFTAGQIGRRLPVAYEKLGGPATFAGALTQPEVEALSKSFAEATYKLEPRATVHLGS